jgi:hypothetical protein
MFPLLTIDVAQTLIAQVSLGCSNPNWVQIIALIPLILLVFVLAAAIVFTVAVIVSPFVMGLNFIQYVFAGLAALFHIPILIGNLTVLGTLTAVMVPVVKCINTLLGCG